VDDPGVVAELQSFGAEGLDLVPGNNIFRKIRLVKTPFEIAQMRLAAQKNADAVFATARQIGAGATQSDIERAFAEEAGKRGATPLFVVLDTIGGLSRGEVQEGQPIMIDAVSHYGHYHGDFGRTIVLGEPTNELTRRSRVIEAAWDAVMSMLRPGVRYSDIARPGLMQPKRPGWEVLTSG
jgi:Xaa-Pro aminopeptidase